MGAPRASARSAGIAILIGALALAACRSAASEPAVDATVTTSREPQPTSSAVGAPSAPTSPTIEPSPAPSASATSASSHTVLERSNLFWAPLTFSADFYHFESLREMAEAADLIVVGRFLGVHRGRSVAVEPGEADSALNFVRARVLIEEILKGAPESRAADEIELELFLASPRRFDDVLANVPLEQNIFFLFNGGALSAREGHPAEVQEQNRYVYIEVSDQAILRNVDGRVSRRPPAAIEDEAEFPAQLEGDAWQDVLERVRQLLREAD